MRAFLWVWSAATLLGCVFAHQLGRIGLEPAPNAQAGAWALDVLDATWKGAGLPPPPPGLVDYRAKGGLVVLAWSGGRVQARHEGEHAFVPEVRAAAARFAADPRLRELAAPPRFTVTVNVGEGRLIDGIPLLSTLFVVPLREGLVAEYEGRRAHLTPDEMVALGLYDNAVKTPIPDLSFGTDLNAAASMLALQLGVDRAALQAHGQIRRFRAHTLAPAVYPKDEAVSRESLLRAARQGVEFLLRHQRVGGRHDGHYVYRYDGLTGRPVPNGGYSLPRHAGTTYFLAQAARVLEMPSARIGALRALRWVRRNAQETCGSPEHTCVRTGAIADMGGAALTALAAAEVLRSGEDAQVRQQLTGLNTFIRAMQRSDGELMHVYDLKNDRPVDVQRMYYSGEAAYALLLSQRVQPDQRDLDTARRLMGHLTGAAWSFFGSRYFYGEEHWTCQAAAVAAEHMPVDEALDFCLRWLEFQRVLMYRPGETPWPAAGAIGVGPVIVPRLTAVASRVEAGALIYRVARDRGLPVGRLRAQMQAHLGVLMRMRWAPGPLHLLADPAGALGGIPATQASLEVRNDFVQHAGSAMLSWAEVLAEESRATPQRPHSPPH